LRAKSETLPTLLDLLGVSIQPQRSRWLVVTAGGICPLYSICTLFLFSLEHRYVGSSDCGGVSFLVVQS
jgi:hypothetical protein